MIAVENGYYPNDRVLAQCRLICVLYKARTTTVGESSQDHNQCKEKVI